MPKRHGNLYDKTFTIDALYYAYKKARRGKRKTYAVMEFERNLGDNINQLHTELHDGSYIPKPYRHFIIAEPKPRQISAPAFRDVVVQHAIYAVINPIFDKTFVDTNYGCRVGKGTHRASVRVQKYMQQSDKYSYTLQMDIRKFYYSIDHSILRALIEKKIKDQRYVDLMMVFAIDGDKTGVPIGNLLSQLYALIYLNPLDHFIKREIKAGKYVRYVDDFIVWCSSRETAIAVKELIREYISNNLNLEFSKWRIATVKAGVNFVGFRTWQHLRIVRKRSLYKFRKSLVRRDCISLTSIMAHALNTSTIKHFCTRIKREMSDLIPSLPLYKEQPA